MTAYSLNISIIFIIYLNFILHSSHGFKVTQPQNRTVSLEGTAFITCEHDANVTSVVDVRLIGISLTDNGKRSTLCQKGKTYCENIIMHQENPNKCLFIILNIGLQALNMKYQCEFTVKKGDLDITNTGSPTVLLPGQKDTACPPSPTPPPPSPSPSSPPPPQSHELRWTLIGLLALMLLYSCVITSFYIRLRINREDSNRGPDNSTYVVMRKAVPPQNPPLGI